MKKVSLFTVILILIAAVFASAYPFSIKDARGKTVVFAKKPTRIVTLTPALAENVCAVGCGKYLVGVSDGTDYPAETKSKPRVGSVKLNTERIVSLKPDLVLADTDLNVSSIGRLEKLGLKLFCVSDPDIASVKATLLTIGKITSHPATAKRAAADLDRAVKEAKAAKKSGKRTLFIVQLNPLWAAGRDTYTDETIRMCGAVNVCGGGRGFCKMSREKTVAANPEVIFTCRKEDTQAILNSPQWRATKAVKTGKVYTVNPDTAVRPGPRLAKGIRFIAEYLK